MTEGIQATFTGTVRTENEIREKIADLKAHPAVGNATFIEGLEWVLGERNYEESK